MAVMTIATIMMVTVDDNDDDDKKVMVTEVMTMMIYGDECKDAHGNDNVNHDESDTLKEAEIGVCASKPKGLRRGSSSEAVLYSPPDSPTMKSLFKPKPRTPSDIVKQTRDLLLRLTSRDDDNMPDLTKNLRDLKSILYGNSESEPVPEACAQLTQEFFADNTLRLLIQYLPKLNLEAIH
ncbi:putative MO25-like protein isoform B [Glycine soja]|uniref:Putative MO25-like protein isoform B n=1 Tax=Glycine soja TaxID=3848 RepID=A0A445G054_GLYSO|nr:putative MO25-like protein isoform B [Glycine soja]